MSKGMAEDICEITCVEHEKVERVREKMVEDEIERMVNMFKGLADKSRMKIVQALAMEGELCVCDTANILGASIATTSHHLRYLRKLGLAKYRKEGKLVYYSLDDDHIHQIVEIAVDHQHELSERENETY